MIVTESKISAICQLRGISREEFDSSIAEKLGDGIYRLKEWEFSSMMSPAPVAPGGWPKGPPQSPPPSGGPGTGLKSLLRDWLGIEASPTCRCNAMALKMNQRGPEWCEGDGMDEILGVMRDEHAKRWADGKTILPWTDAGARQLVLLACRRSRAKASG